MTGMLVSGSTVQVWLEWSRVPRDISDAVKDQQDGDIIVYTPLVVEVLEAFECFVKLLNADLRVELTTRAGTIFVKRAVSGVSLPPLDRSIMRGPITKEVEQCLSGCKGRRCVMDKGHDDGSDNVEHTDGSVCWDNKYVRENR